MKTPHIVPRLVILFIVVFSEIAAAQTPQQFRIDIDSTRTSSTTTSGSVATEPGWHSIDATNGNGASVTIDGIPFTVIGAASDASRRRSGGTALIRDFIFDRGEGDDVRLQCGIDVTGFPEGRWRARIWMWDTGVSGFEANIMSAGWKELDTVEWVVIGGVPTPILRPGTEYLQDDAVVPKASTHAIEFAFYSDGGPFELFVRENSSFDRSRINAVELTQLDVGMDDSNAFALDTRNARDTPEFAVNTHHPDIIHNTGLPDTSPGSFPISMAMLKVTGGPTAVDNITFRLLAPPLYGTLRRNGSVLGVNQAFTQAQIDAGQITYERPAGSPRVTDVLEMSAKDQSGNGLAGGSLFFIVGNAGEGSSGLIVVDTRNREDSNPLFTADTRGPDVITNTGIQDPGNGATTITMGMFLVTGGLDGMDEITFTLLTTPQHGVLKLNGTELGAGDRFSQAQVDAGEVVYERTPGAPLPDPLELEAVDESGYGLAAGSVTFVVGDAGSAMFVVDTRNFSDFGTHTVHTDNRVYVVPDTVPGSLRQAVSNASDGETVDFDPATNAAKLVLTNGEIQVNKDLTIDASTLGGGVAISGNNASRVFAISTGNVELNALNLTEGNDSSTGGAIWNRGSLLLRNSTVSHSEAQTGGGIYNRNGGRVTLENSTVAGNLASGSGGGISSPNPIGLPDALELVHSTVADNEAASDGGGIHGRVEHLENSIIAGNSAGGTGPDFLDTGGSTALAGVNLLGDLAGSGLSVGPSLLEDDPRLAVLADYGGGTPTMPPLPGSPVIDQAAILVGTPGTDQRGATRPNGPGPDIGAVEAFPFCHLTLIDSDGDAIDDRLELGYPQFAIGSNDAALDSDGDGIPDGAELDAMTDPLDGNDYLRLEMFPAAGFDPVNNPEWTFRIETFPGLTYQLEDSTNLTDFDPMSGGLLTATAGLSEISYLIEQIRAFYRVSVVKPAAP